MSLRESISTLVSFAPNEGRSINTSPQHTYGSDEYYEPMDAMQAGKIFSSPSAQAVLCFATNNSSTQAGARQTPTIAQFVTTPTSDARRSSDFSFLQHRPASTCAPRANVTPRSSRSSSVSEARASSRAMSLSTKAKTDLRNSICKSKLSAVGSSQPLLASSRGKIRRQQPHFSPAPLTPTSSSTYNRPSTLLHAKKLPLRLPRPPLALITDPHADLPGHLRRHGLDQDADNFSGATGITVEYVMHMWVRNTSNAGPAGLLNVTSTFMDTYGAHIREQLTRAQDTDRGLPRTFFMPSNAVSADDMNLPTHVLAVHGNDVNDKGILIPCHSLMYILQCVSLPSFAGSSMLQDDEEAHGMVFADGSTLRVVPLRVPRPKEFALLHRFIYTRDTVALLSDLLPMRTIARYCDQTESSSKVDTLSDMSLLLPVTLPEEVSLKLDPSALEALFADPLPMQPQGSTLSNSATQALSYLPLQSLFSLAYRIHSAWANGVAIGFLEPSYWTTLDRAWTLVVAALAIKKGRLLDSESRGLNVRRS